MKYLWDALRMIFVSFECLFILAVCLLNQYQSGLFVALGDNITSDTEVTKWLPAIPFGLAIYCFVDVIWKLITPLSGSNRKLHEWPDFWRLKMRSYYSLVLSAIYASMALGIWVFSKQLSHSCIGILFALSLGLSLINAGCMVFASFTLRIILEVDEGPDSNK